MAGDDVAEDLMILGVVRPDEDGRAVEVEAGAGAAGEHAARFGQDQVGGGVAFAPKPRSYRYTVNKKVRRLAMFSALSSKVIDKEIIVVDSLEFAEPKTKDMIKFLEAVKAGKKSLIVTDAKNENVVRSANNIPGVTTTTATQMNVYEIINHNSFIITKDAVKKIEEVYA